MGSPFHRTLNTSQMMLNLIDQIINPYVVKKQAELSLPETQKAIVGKLKSLNLPVPANMTHFFQPLDLTVNASVKKFVRNRFSKYYSNTVKQQLDDRKQLDDVAVDFHPTTVKPLHTQWLLDIYNHSTTSKDMEIIVKGWNKSGIAGLFDESIALPAEDPFLECYSEQ